MQTADKTEQIHVFYELKSGTLDYAGSFTRKLHDPVAIIRYFRQMPNNEEREIEQREDEHIYIKCEF